MKLHTHKAHDTVFAGEDLASCVGAAATCGSQEQRLLISDHFSQWSVAAI